MARSLTNDFKVACIAGTVRPLMLFEAFFDSGTLRFYNGLDEIEYGGETYIGAGNLLRVGKITETQNIEARGAFYDLSGVPSSLIYIATAEPYHGRALKQRLVLLDADYSIIADPFMIFSGLMDVMTINLGRQSSTIRMTAENDLITLTRGNERRHTPEDQKLKYADDTFFDHVVSLQSREITWGRNAK